MLERYISSQFASRKYCVYLLLADVVLVKGTTSIKVAMMATLFPSAGNKQMQLKPHMRRFNFENRVINSLAASHISTKHKQKRKLQ